MQSARFQYHMPHKTAPNLALSVDRHPLKQHFAVISYHV
jgi:hypothetical protein